MRTNAIQGSVPGYTGGNKVDLFSSDPESLKAVLKDITSAKRKIQFEAFLLNSEHGEAIVDALIERHKAGVKVEVLLDKTGQKLDSERLANKLKDAGVEVRYYDTDELKMSLIAVDHTKLAVVDDSIAWEGGANFDSEINRDLMCRIQGPSVREVQKLFVDAWKLSGGQEELPSEVPAMQGDVYIKVTETSPGVNSTRTALTDKLKSLNKGDKLDLWMMDLGDHSILKELLKAKERGAEIRVLLDKAVPFSGRVSGFFKSIVEKIAGGAPDLDAVNKLQKAGVPVRYYQAPDGITKLHSKVAIFTTGDQKEVVTGSTNWIKGAFDYNHEMAAFMQGGNVAEQIEGFFEEDWTTHSKEIKRLSVGERIKSLFVGLFTRTLADASPASTDKTNL